MNNNQKQSDTLGWLTTVLPNDSNFVSALNRAREAELEEATEIMSPKAGSKTRIIDHTASAT